MYIDYLATPPGSPIGLLEIRASDQGITHIRFVDEAAHDARPHPLIERCKAQLAEYFRGARREFSLPLAPQGTAFQQRVWQRLREVPFGDTCSYATISRDIKELGLVKRAVDGAYQKAQIETPSPAVTGDRVRRAVVEYLCRADRVQQLLVLKTDPGQAQSLAFALDQAAWPGVVGTLAGDDTILVVMRTERGARTLERRLERWAKG